MNNKNHGTVKKTDVGCAQAIQCSALRYWLCTVQQSRNQ